MLQGAELDFRCSFGPQGRSKIVRNQSGGSFVVTKDGQQLLDCYCTDPEHRAPLEHALIKMCCSVSKEYGDGSMSTLLTMTSVIRAFSATSSESSVGANRIVLLNALKIVMHAVNMHKEMITKFMTETSIWLSAGEAYHITRHIIMPN
jgi:chaperonin GroEL (HSP60 family)